MAVYTHTAELTGKRCYKHNIDGELGRVVEVLGSGRANREMGKVESWEVEGRGGARLF